MVAGGGSWRESLMFDKSAHWRHSPNIATCPTIPWHDGIRLVDCISWDAKRGALLSLAFGCWVFPKEWEWSQTLTFPVLSPGLCVLKGAIEPEFYSPRLVGGVRTLSLKASHKAGAESHSRRVLPCPWGEGMQHKEAKKNLSRQALPVPCWSITNRESIQLSALPSSSNVSTNALIPGLRVQKLLSSTEGWLNKIQDGSLYFDTGGLVVALVIGVGRYPTVLSSVTE